MEVESSSSSLNDSQYLFMALDEIFLQIQYCISNHLYSKALVASVYYEMALAEEFGLKELSDPSASVMDEANILLLQKFYTLYMMLFLIMNDLEGARHLWRRAPAVLTSDSTGSFSRSWEVGKCLYKQDIAGAYQLLVAAPWPSDFENNVSMLQQSIRDRALLLLSKAYKKVSLRTVVSYGGFNSTDKAIEVCKEMGWSVDTSHEGTVTPLSSGTVASSTELHDHIKLMQSLTSYVSGFEKKHLRVEITKIPTSKGMSNVEDGEGM